MAGYVPRAGRRRRAELHSALLLVHVLAAPAWATQAAAQASPAAADDPHEANEVPERAAARHFEAALGHADRKEFALAVAEFERAYQLSPHHSVSYNLGLSYVALGQSLRAIAAFERSLAEAGSDLSPERRLRIEALIATERKRLGRLALDVSPSQTLVSIDGEAPASVGGELSLDPGVHRIVASAPGYATQTSEVTIAPGELSAIRIDLAQSSPGPRSFEIICAVPDVRLSADGVEFAATRGGAAKVQARLPSTAQTLEMSRPGYITRRIDLTKVNGGARVACEIQPDPRAQLGRLSLAVAPARARASLDGLPFRGQALVHGRHVLRVEHPGFEPWSGFVQIPARGMATLRVELSPTAAELERLEQAASSRRTWAYLAGGGALVLAGTALGVLVRSNDLYDDWKRRQHEISMTADVDVRARLESENLELEGDIKTLDGVSIGLGLGSAALLGLGSYWYFTEPELDADAEGARAAHGPRLGFDGSQLLLQGSF